MELPQFGISDWQDKLHKDEIFDGPNGPAPKLAGLRRLAKPLIQKEESRVDALIVVPKQIVRELKTYDVEGNATTQEVLGLQHFPMAAVTFTITLKDGTVVSDSADAYYGSCQELGHHPAAVASARSESRCLRKILGIAQHAAEEITDKTAEQELAPDEDTPVKPTQIKLIEKMIADIGLSVKDLISSITAREIFVVKDLTVAEGRSAIKHLNLLKKKKK